jgi:hypothetical protein
MSFDPHWFDQQVIPRLTLDAAYPGVEWTRRGGKEWRARCPIHGGKNPESFCVNTETLLSYCQSCGHRGGPLAYWWALTHDPLTRPRGRDAWLGMLELADRVGVEAPGRGSRETVWERNPLPVRPEPFPPEYPPTSEVWALWRMSERPSTGAAAVVESWGVDAAAVDREIRVVPEGLSWSPEWARTRGVRWGRGGYEIVVPLRDHEMKPRSYVARSLDPSKLRDAPKTGCPAGYTTRALVMANAAAVSAVRTGDCSWGTCIVREGERDWLFDAQRDAPVIGTRSGAWSDDLTRALPHGWTLEIATDHDAKGDELASVIVESLARSERDDIWWERTQREDAR